MPTRNGKGLLLALCLFGPSSSALAELPTTQELIRQVEEACREHEKENGENADWPLMALGQAQAYAGDYRKAIQTADRISGIWKNIALNSCWEANFERTGEITPFLPSSSEDHIFARIENETSRIEIAKALVKVGRFEDAITFLPKDENNRGTAIGLMNFYLFLAEDQNQRNNKFRVHASLKKALALVDRQHKGRQIDSLEKIANHFLKVGERQEVLRVVLLADQRIRATRKEKATSLLALDWARVGKLQGICGQEQQAREAFGQAFSLLEACDKNEKVGFTDNDLRTLDYINTLGQIGIYQFVGGLKNEASESYRKAIARAGRIKNEGKRDFQLHQLLEKQLEHGDIEGAWKSFEQLHGANYRAISYCGFALTFDKKGEQPAAKEVLQKLASLAESEPKLSSRIEILVKIADVKGKAGDLAGAKDCLEKAKKTSRSAKESGPHQWIVRCQVRLGLFEDAYSTIQEISDLNLRLLPLAELARHVAKKEALAKKKQTKK